MASGNIAKARMEDSEVSTLMQIAGRAAEDLRSQVGRLGSNLNLARNFGRTELANGIIDDRKYLVSSIIAPQEVARVLTTGISV